MTLTVRELLAAQAHDRCFGRDATLSSLSALLRDARPVVMALHGLGGVGKSCVARHFGGQARASGATVLWVDGQSVEPSPRGVVEELFRQLGMPASGLRELIAALRASTARVIIVIDAYERCRLLDAWLRQAFVPELGLNVRLLLVGRDAPVEQWRVAPGWADLFASHELGPLDTDAALTLLQEEGLSPDDAVRAQRFARGHALALKLAGGVMKARPGMALDATHLHGAVESLVDLYLADVVEAPLRMALQRMSVVRRITVSLLRAMVPDHDAAALFEKLSALSITSLANDGLLIHDVVRDAIAAHFRARDPAGCLEARRAAWRQLQTESRDAPSSELWRYTADLLYMVEAPSVREVFFPTGSQALAVEPARSEDRDDILAITRQHDGAEGVECISRLWACLPTAFRVTRAATNQVNGYSCLAELSEVPEPVLRSDPLFASWREHVRAAGLGPDDRVLFLRRLVADAESSRPREVEAALMLDIKRAYLELRPHLRRLYSHLRQVTELDTFLRDADFQFAPDIDVSIDGVRHRSALIDFGPQSVDGWLSRLVAATLGEPEPTPAAAPAVRIDPAARELWVGERRVALTSREFEVLSYLMQHEGQAVKRGDLLDEIWGTRYEGGSNVIDAVVLSLRRKLGDRASAIETVVRFGYRFRQP